MKLLFQKTVGVGWEAEGEVHLVLFVSILEILGSTSNNASARNGGSRIESRAGHGSTYL